MSVTYLPPNRERDFSDAARRVDTALARGAVDEAVAAFDDLMGAYRAMRREHAAADPSSLAELLRHHFT